MPGQGGGLVLQWPTVVPACKRQYPPRAARRQSM